MKFSRDEKFSEDFIESFKQNFMTFYTGNMAGLEVGRLVCRTATS